MTFTTRLDHGQRLVILYWETALTQDDLSRNLEVFRAPDFPAHYDLIHTFDPRIRIEIDHTVVVGHAIERQRTLQERGVTHQLRSAFVDVPAPLKSIVEIWPLFFPDSEQSLSIRMFDTLDEALDWLGRAPFDEAALETFSL
ncbi:hypothetical protein ACFELO_00335 [Oceanicaulis sp. LC35]|uniref:hypothetical protein n=1 Tax=Oceanicaulis sp. LC35 TaxID=3349635 RepID=UPI003F857DCD